MEDLKGKTAIVTGGSRGIGRAIVLTLANCGCNIAFNYLNSETEAKNLVEEVRNKQVKCTATKVDVKNYGEVKEWIEQIKKDFGGIDFLVNNAGIVRDKPLMMMSEDDWHQVLDTNLTGLFNVARLCIVTLMKQKKGKIVNISSVSGVIGLPGQTNYSSTKGGINAFTKALAKEVAAYGIQVNAVAPGFIETDILAELTDEKRSWIEQNVPLGRVGNVSDVANCVKFLLSENGDYVTGQIIQVDGGLAMR